MPPIVWSAGYPTQRNASTAVSNVSCLTVDPHGSRQPFSPVLASQLPSGSCWTDTVYSPINRCQDFTSAVSIFFPVLLRPHRAYRPIIVVPWFANHSACAALTHGPIARSHNDGSALRNSIA